uniref:Ribosomal protein L10 n=1 Tax=Jakoba libera TaxID=143017 RepID=M4QA44_JAKLI|nr:ribosomal protein L10 [Jakoba libera]AGH24226.1 ribosomal protein L10 [Jakoba libera]
MKKRLKKWKVEEYTKEMQEDCLVIFLDYSKLGQSSCSTFLQTLENQKKLKEVHTKLTLCVVKNSLYRKVLQLSTLRSLETFLRGPVLKVKVKVSSTLENDPFLMFFLQWLEKQSDYVFLGAKWNDQLVNLKQLKCACQFNSSQVVSSLYPKSIQQNVRLLRNPIWKLIKILTFVQEETNAIKM